MAWSEASGSMNFRVNCSNIPWVQSQQSSCIAHINHPKINPPIFQGLEKRLSFEFCIETLSMFFLFEEVLFPESPKGPNEVMKIGWWLEAPNVVSSGSSVFATLKTPSSTREWRLRRFGSFLAIEVFVFVKYMLASLWCFFVWNFKGKPGFFLEGIRMNGMIARC